jgi:hypothetical protein
MKLLYTYELMTTLGIVANKRKISGRILGVALAVLAGLFATGSVWIHLVQGWLGVLC